MEDKTVIVNYCNQTDGSLSPIRQQELLSSQLEPCWLDSTQHYTLYRHT